METPGFQRELMTLGAHGPPEIAAKTVRVVVGKRMFLETGFRAFIRFSGRVRTYKGQQCFQSVSSVYEKESS